MNCLHDLGRITAANASAYLNTYEHLNSPARLAKQHRLADNPATPPAALTAYGNSGDTTTRMRVARNPNTPPDVLERLAHDYLCIRLSVAYNPNLPPRGLARLLRDDWPVVRLTAAAQGHDRIKQAALATLGATLKGTP